MYARVATFEGGDPEQVRKSIAEINERSSSGPPEGVPAVGLTIMHNAEGKVVSIVMFESEADLEQGDATLNGMDPPTPGGMGRRVAVEKFEVGVQRDA